MKSFKLLGLLAIVIQLTYISQTLGMNMYYEYRATSRGVYYDLMVNGEIEHSELIKGSHGPSFEMVDSRGFVGKDKNAVYYKGIPMVGADSETFKKLQGAYHFFHDKYNLYYGSKIVPGISGDSVQVVDEKIIKDIDTVIIHWNDLRMKVEGADAESFTTLGAGREDGFFKDKSGLYYYTKKFSNNIIDVNPQLAFSLETQYLSTNDEVFFRGEKVANADPETFKTIDFPLLATNRMCKGVYGQDATNMYYKQYVLEGIDPETFEVVGCFPGYSKDKNSVYYRQNKIDGADPKTFTTQSFLLSGKHTTFGKDAKNVYYFNYILDGVNPQEFALSRDTEIRSDGTNIYIGQYVLKGADPATFRSIPNENDAQYVESGSGVISLQSTLPPNTNTINEKSAEKGKEDILTTIKGYILWNIGYTISALLLLGLGIYMVVQYSKKK